MAQCSLGLYFIGNMQCAFHKVIWK